MLYININSTLGNKINFSLQYLESMQLKYHEKAAQHGVYIIGSCGFDSIPIEAGIQFVKQATPGDVNCVETFVEFKHGPKVTTTE